MADPEAAIVELDRSGTVWVGRFDGVGEVRVGSDGEIDVRCTGPDPTAEASLLHGWAELLSFARRGVPLLAGVTVAPESGRAVLITGDPIGVGEIIAALTSSGWSVVSDRPSPVRFGPGAVTALPRPSPLLVHAAGERPTIRPDSNVAALDARFVDQPVVLGATVEVALRRVGEHDDVELHGHDRFEHAVQLLTPGALAPDRPATGASGDDSSDPADGDLIMGEHLQLAALPALRLRLDPDGSVAASERLRDWIARIACSP